MSPGPGRKPLPVRYRLAVPVADTTVNEWLSSQDNVSASVRAVIRDYIERNGFEDPTCKPVEQLPRKGRPPGSGAAMERDASDHDDSDHDDSASDDAVSTMASPAPSAPRVSVRDLQEAAGTAPDDSKGLLGLQIAEVTGRTAEGRAQEAAVAAAAAAQRAAKPAERAPVQHPQADITKGRDETDENSIDGREDPVDMDDIFSSGRNR